MKSFLKSVGAGIFVAITFASVFLPNPEPARALGLGADIVNDPWNTAVNTVSQGYNLITSTASQAMSFKYVALNPIAWALAKAAIASMTQSMVNWINSGFNGSPAFVTNLDVYLSDVNFVTENSFINQISTNPALNSPFQSQVASLLNLSFLKSSASNGFFLQHPYTLNQYSSNPTGFVNGTTDFTSGGGFGAWFALTTQPENNIYGEYDLSAMELQSRLDNSRSNALTQLGWGQGFLSWCGNATGGGGGSNAGGACTTDDDCAGSLMCGPNWTCVVDSSVHNPASTCTTKDGGTGTIQTPGSVIQAQLNKTLGLSGDTLVTADEFNEVIGALMGQLVNQVVGGVGLSGASSVSSGGTGYVDRAASQQASASTAGTTVTSAISSQLQQVTQYQSDWQTIGNEANAAQAALSGQCTRSPAGAAAAVSSVIAQASTASARAATAIAGLNSIRNEITAAGNNATALSQASNDYQTLITGANFPSATDIAYADAQTQDVTTQANSSTPLTALPLYSQMKLIVGMCSGAIS